MHHPIKTTGGIVRHAMGVLLRGWVRAFRAGGITALVVSLATEIVGSIVAHHFPPPAAIHLLAFGLAAALGYGVALTVLADELIVGIIDAIRLLSGEAEAGARAIGAIAEHEASAIYGRWGGLLHLTGLHKVVRAPAEARPTGLSPETLAELATLAPGILRERVVARPVRPGELGVSSPGTQPRPTVTITQPIAPEAPAAKLASTGAADAASAVGSLSPSLTRATVPLSGEVAALGGLAEPAAWLAGDNPPPGTAAWHDPQAAQASATDESESADEGGIQPVDLFGAPPPAAPRPADEPLVPPPPVPVARPLPNTRPLPDQTRPLDATTRPLETGGGMWDHISQMLAGRPIPSLPEDAPPSPPPDGEGMGG